jgi:alpha-tubulin suppressor-like RCC1 family protein
MATNNSTNTTSPIQISMGGTNTNTFTNTDGVVYFDGTKLADTVVGTSGYVLTSNGTGNAPTFQAATGGFPWQDVSGTSQSVAVANGYFANNAAPVSMYLPATAAIGDEVKFSNKGAGGFLVVPSSGQSVNFLTDTATNPQYFSTSDIFAAMDLVCETANTAWNVVNHEGSFGVITPPPPTPTFSVGFGASSSNNNFMFFIKNNGSGWGCGRNDWGETGNQTLTQYSSPVSVVGGFNFIGIAGGAADSNMALDSNGNAWGWGFNGSGGLGNGTLTEYSSPVSVIGNHVFMQISNGNAHGLGVKSNGQVWTFGLNSSGQLGTGDTTNQSSPVSVIGGFNFTQAYGAYNSTIFLDSTGTFYSCGDNLYGQSGNLTTSTSYSSPVAAVGNHSFIKISGNGVTSAGIKSDGTCWCWGYGGDGEIGDGTSNSYSSPVSVIGAHSFIDITISGTTSFPCSSLFGLKSNGEVWCWGSNIRSSLGDGTANSRSSPVLLAGGHSFVRLMVNSQGLCGAAITSNGSIYSWGKGDDGGLGDGDSNNDKSVPILVLNTP